MTRFFIALAAAAAPFATPLAAQTPTPAPATAAPARVSVPFNPPLDRPLRYRNTTTKQREGRPLTVWIDYELRFTRRPNGYRLAVHAMNAGSPDMPAAQQGLVRQTVVGLSLPYVLLLNAQGLIEGMEDAEGYWDRLMTLTEQAIRQNVSSGGPTDETALRHMMGLMRDSSPEARLAILTQNIAPVLQFGTTEYVIGEDRRSEDQVEGLMGVAVRQHSTLRAERVENGRLRLTMRATVPAEDMRRAIEGFMARIPVTGQGRNNQAERERGMAQFRAARIDRRSEFTFEVALDSGLVQTLSGEDRTEIEMGGQRHSQSETTRIERRE